MRSGQTPAEARLPLFVTTLAAIAGPNINGWIVKLTGNNYASIFIIGPIFMIAALVMILGLQSGEAKSNHVVESQS